MGQSSSKSEDIIQLALDYGYWLYGGYLRDFISEGRFRDIDLGCTLDQVLLFRYVISKLQEA